MSQLLSPLPIYQVVILALVQAITEFLPISSTAHLALVPWLLKWPDPGLAFDVALHLGTLAAVLLYFWRFWLRLGFAGLGLAPPSGIGPAATGAATGPDEEAAADRRLLWLLVIATIPAAAFGLAFQRYVETTLRSPYVMAASMIGIALLMAYGEKISRRLRPLNDLRLSDSLVVGCAQALALVPGVSRSGITITAALLRDFRRDTAARFSFLLSAPVVGGAAAKEGFHLLRAGLPADMRVPFLVGIAVSGVIGYLVVAFLIRYLQTRTLKIFVYYRLVFGIIILVLAIFSSAR